MLVVNNVSKRYADREVLVDVTFAMQAGEKVGLIGRNGSGKSVLLHLLAGIEAPDKGSIQWSPGARPGYLAQLIEPEGASTVGDALASGQTPWLDAKVAMERSSTLLERSDAPNDSELDQFANALTAFEALGGYDVEQRMEEVLSGLGIGEIPLDRDVRMLSGGEKTRVGLGSLLLSGASALLLDEPTNYLDLPALHWLEGFIQRSSAAAVIVSHDRAFLDATVSSILAIDDSAHSVKVYQGGYSAYLQERLREREDLEARYRDQLDREKRVMRDIRRLKGDARSIERGTTHFHYRKIAKGVARRATVQERRLRRSIDDEEHLDRPEYEQRLYLGSLKAQGMDGTKLVFRVDRIDCTVGAKVILSDVSVTVRSGSRIALLGANGSGKSTLLRTIVESWPGDSKIRWGQGVSLGLLQQEYARSEVKDHQTVLSAMRERASGEESALRAVLDQFLFSGREVDRMVRDLSYGERVRLELALLVGGGANLLMLDEPTSHLDLPAVESLQSALAAFQGPMIVVSHDRAFLHGIGITGVWLADRGSLAVVEGEGALGTALPAMGLATKNDVIRQA